MYFCVLWKSGACCYITFLWKDAVKQFLSCPTIHYGVNFEIFVFLLYSRTFLERYIQIAHKSSVLSVISCSNHTDKQQTKKYEMSKKAFKEH